MTSENATMCYMVDLGISWELNIMEIPTRVIRSEVNSFFIRNTFIKELEAEKGSKKCTRLHEFACKIKKSQILSIIYLVS